MNNFKIVKNYVADMLEKAGSSVEEFEQHLNNINTGEGVLKTANTLTDMVNTGTSLMGEVAVPIVVGTGAAGGLMLDQVDKAVKEDTTKLQDMQKNIQLLRRLNTQLKAEHGIA